MDEDRNSSSNGPMSYEEGSYPLLFDSNNPWGKGGRSSTPPPRRDFAEITTKGRVIGALVGLFGTGAAIAGFVLIVKEVIPKGLAMTFVTVMAVSIAIGIASLVPD